MTRKREATRSDESQGDGSQGGGPRSGGERLAAVAAASRSGASAADAWREWDRGTVVKADGVPDLGRSDPLARDALAAARLAHRSGVPLADLVSALARVETVREAGRLSREVALAGPRASARLLSWLPLVGLALGVLVEPRTLAVLFATPVGWVMLTTAAALMAVGRRWMGALVRRAVESGRVP